MMETQDVNETGGLAFLAASKTSKDFSLVTSRFCSSSVLRSIMTRLSSGVLLNFNTALRNIDHRKHANTLISHSKHCLRDLTKQINHLYYHRMIHFFNTISYDTINNKNKYNTIVAMLSRNDTVIYTEIYLTNKYL